MLKAGKIKLIIQIDETKGNPSLSHLKTISCLSIQSLHDSIMLFTVRVSTFSLPSSGNPSVLSTTGSKIWRMAYSTYVLRWYGTPIMFNKISLTIMVSIGECSFTVLAPYYTLISLFSDQAIKITTLDFKEYNRTSQSLCKVQIYSEYTWLINQLIVHWSKLKNTLQRNSH